MTMDEITKNDVKQFNCIGYVKIKNTPETINNWKQYGYDVTYDYILFDSWDEMKNYINGIYAYDYMDTSCILHTDEKIIGIYVYGKIINNVSRETWGF